MVRLTFKIRSYALADKPKRDIALSKSFSLSLSIRQTLRIKRGVICAFEKIPSC